MRPFRHAIVFQHLECLALEEGLTFYAVLKQKALMWLEHIQISLLETVDMPSPFEGDLKSTVCTYAGNK